MPDYRQLRERMVREQIAGRGILSGPLLDAFREVPREAFVAPELGPQAYEDHPLPIEAGQTISQPYIVALMIDAARVGPGDRLLEVGAGSGYAAAIVGRIAREVIALERQPQLAFLAAERMERLGYSNVAIVEADGTQGWPAGAPYDVILVAAAGNRVPRALVAQLAPGGRLVMPVGGPDQVQQLVRMTKDGAGDLREEALGAVRFVPLIGGEGWSGP